MSLGLALALLVGVVRPLWPVSGASYAAWLRVQLRGALAESVLEEGLQDALADRPATPEAFVRAFLRACAQKEGKAAIRRRWGFRPRLRTRPWWHGCWLVPRLVAEPILTPLLQASGGALLAGLQRVVTAVFAANPDLREYPPALILPVALDVPVSATTTLLFGAVLPMGP
ncbi:hypothetical protein [Rhodothermus marinus]|uniref:hypothetical protein n=1 Tax=Rhodothermus marinus TaxID=29549 RepID=UPI001FB1CC67|nr:hypothetical protein [Rhodothermus marinus]